MTTKQTIGRLVGFTSLALQTAVTCIEFSHWRPIADWWSVDFAAALILVAGSLYAAMNARRWWYAIFAVASLSALTMALTRLDLRAH